MDSNGKMTSFCNAEDYRRWKNKWESIQQLHAVRQIFKYQFRQWKLGSADCCFEEEAATVVRL